MSWFPGIFVFLLVVGTMFSEVEAEKVIKVLPSLLSLDAFVLASVKFMNRLCLLLSFENYKLLF